MKDTHKKQEPEVPMIEKEKYLRLAADMDNLRKMQGHAAAEMAKWSAQAVITDMLELSDLLDTALAHAPPGATGGAWYEGLKQISKQFRKITAIWLIQDLMEEIHLQKGKAWKN